MHEATNATQLMRGGSRRSGPLLVLLVVVLGLILPAGAAHAAA